MKYVIFICTLIICFSLSSCSSADPYFGPKYEVSSYNEEVYTAKLPLELDLSNDSGNVEFYGWDKREVKFEITKKIKGVSDKAVLKNLLKNFQVTVKQDDGKILFNSRYKGFKKKFTGNNVDLKVYIPKNLKAVNLYIGTGSVKFFDYTKCILNAEINMANMVIGRFEGRLNIKANMGNLTIENGTITGDSNVEINMGNLNIKAEFDSKGIYTLKTNMGNIDLLLPSDSAFCFETIGTVDTNEFAPLSSSARIKLVSGMGRMSIRKY